MSVRHEGMALHHDSASAGDPARGYGSLQMDVVRKSQMPV